MAESWEVTPNLSVFEISLDASSDIAGLTIAIRSLSDNVEEVRIDIYNSFCMRWSEDGIQDLFFAVGDMPQLRKVEFYGLVRRSLSALSFIVRLSMQSLLT